MGRMDEWPAWQRWGTWLCGWVVYVGAFWILLAVHDIGLRILALAGVCAGLLVLTWSSKAVLNERMRGIDRWQLRVILPAFLVYMVLALFVLPLVDDVTSTWLKAAIVLSPMVPIVVIAWAMVRYVNSCDEMERRQHLEAAGIAVVLVGIACMALGLLAAAKLVAVSSVLVLLLVLPALCVVYGLACTWSKWRNRAR